MKDIPLFTIDWIMNHLGKNPRKGGKPPNESKDVNSKNFIVGLSLLNKNVWLINEIWNGEIIEIIVKVKKE